MQLKHLAKKHLCLLYPTDITAATQGGVESFIRDSIAMSQFDFYVSFIGVTTDQHSRPVGVWTSCQIYGATFNFLPVCHVKELTKRQRFPITFRYLCGLYFFKNRIPQDIDLFEFHRIEPVWILAKMSAKKTAFLHQDMSVIHSRQGGILWRKLPWINLWLEHILLSKFDSIFCVNQRGTQHLKKQYPKQASKISFFPTWVNTDIFRDVSLETRLIRKNRLLSNLGKSEASKIVVSTGRLDRQKNFSLLIDAFSLVVQKQPNTLLIIMGDGVLMPQLKSLALELGLSTHVFFWGAVSQEQVAETLAAADVFCLSSYYEGMSISLLEALASGIPVVATDVGENATLITDGVNGYITADFSKENLANDLLKIISSQVTISSDNCVAAVQGLSAYRCRLNLNSLYKDTFF